MISISSINIDASLSKVSIWFSSFLETFSLIAKGALSIVADKLSI